jgi:hypothetical protein
VHDGARDEIVRAGLVTRNSSSNGTGLAWTSRIPSAQPFTHPS